MPHRNLDRIKKGMKLYLFGIAIVLSMGYYIIHLKTNLNLSQSKISLLELTIRENNKTIEKLQIDTEEYKLNETILRQKIKDRYSHIEKGDECESELRAINESLNVFFHR